MATIQPESLERLIDLEISGVIDEGDLDDIISLDQETADMLINDILKNNPLDTSDVSLSTPDVPQDTAWKADNAGLDDLAREVFRRAEAEGEPITMEEARLQTAYAPRGTRARLQPNANQYFQPVADFKDVYDTGIRMGHGLFARSNDQQGIEDNVNPLEEMYRTQANPQTGFLGTSKEVGENIFRDPLTALGGPIAKGLFSLGSKLYQPASKLMSGLLGGAGVAGAEVAIEQEGRREQGLPYMGLDETALNVGLGTVLGGASGKLSDVKSNKQALADSPNILGRADDEGIDLVESVVSNPKKAEEKMLFDVMGNTGFSMNQAKSIPIYAREMFAQLDEGGKEQLNKYLTQGRVAASNTSLITPYDEVGKMFLRGEEAIGKARQQAGSTMGEIEGQFLQGGAIDMAPIKSRWSEIMADLARAERVVDDNGVVSYVDAPNRAMIDDDMMAQFMEIDNKIQQLGEFETGQRLRDIEQTIGNIGARPNSTRSGVMNSTADLAVKTIIPDMRDLIGKQIKEEGGEEAFKTYQQAKKDYGRYWNQQDFIQRRLGQIIEDAEGEKIATRGGSMVKAMNNSAQARNAPALARMIKELTGEDIGKHGAMAKFGMQVAGDIRAGHRKVDISKTGVMNWLKDKTVNRGIVGDTFGEMTDLVQKVNPNQTPSILEQAGSNPYVQATGDIFGNYGQSSLRSGGRGMFSGKQESNKVTEKPIGGIGAEKIRQGMGQ